MPFTPFHMGPGCALKVFGGKHFSLTVFGFAQVAMDIQPLIKLLTGAGVWHGFSHTYLGAALIGLFSAIVGRPVCQLLLNVWKPDPADGFMIWLRSPPVLSWPATFAGAFIGSFSHVFIDSLVHADVEPFAPMFEGNPLAESVTFGAMHLLCIGFGMFGVLGLLIRGAVDSA